MIVIDASALTDVLLPTERGRELAPLLRAAGRDVHAPGLLDAEVTSAIRRAERGGEVPVAQAEAALEDLAGLPIVRHADQAFLARAWALRANFTVYDALYVALAEAIEAPLLTSDGRLSAAVAAHTDVALAAS